MKTQNLGTWHSVMCYRPTFFVPSCPLHSLSHCRVGLADFKIKRLNGNEIDNPPRKFPEDGKYTWVKGRVEGDRVYGVKNASGSYEYEVRYDQGPADKAWMEETDKNYLERIECEGNLKKLEPAVYYLRLQEHATNNIRDWWTQKLLLPNLPQVLEQAEKEATPEAIEKLEQEAKLKEQQAAQKPCATTSSSCSIPQPATAATAAAVVTTQITVPEEYRCSITSQIMIDPVIAADGETYEREAITKWLETKNTSPLHGDQLEHLNLTPNNTVRRSINAFLTQNPQFWETNEIYFSENLKRRLIQAVAERNKNEVDRILAIDRRLLTRELNVEHQNLLSLAIHSNSEILQLAITKLGDNFLKLPEVRNNNGTDIFIAIATNLGLDGARIIGTRLNWKAGDYQRLLDIAINSRDVQLADICLKLGANVNAQDATGNSCLHRGVLIGNQALVTVMLNNGARINEQNREGNTAAHLAVQQKDLAILNLLIMAQTNLNLLNTSKLSYLHLALQNVRQDAGSYPIIVRLIEAGADLETQNPEGNTALLAATKANRVDLVKLMLERHANVAAQTQGQNTALHVAAGQGNKDMALLLLQNKANGKAKNAQKKKPADVAREAGHDDLAKFIETERLEMKFMPLPFFVQLRQESQRQKELAQKQQQEIQEQRQLIQQQQTQIAALTAKVQQLH